MLVLLPISGSVLQARPRRVVKQLNDAASKAEFATLTCENHMQPEKTLTETVQPKQPKSTLTQPRVIPAGNLAVNLKMKTCN